MPGEELKRIEFKGNVALSFDNVMFLILSSILAGAALLAGSMPVLIGAMILAPTFDPLMAVPVGLLNHDWKLARRGLVNSLVMFSLVFLFCLATVWFITGVLDLYTRQGVVGVEMITERLVVNWASVIVALVAGAGGAIAFASERRENQVGVVVALALVPALAAAAIGFLASPLNGWGGLALFSINFSGVIFAGYLVLLLRVVTGKVEEQREERKKSRE